MNTLTLILLAAIIGSIAYDVYNKRQWNKLEKERLKLSIQLLKRQLEE